MIVLLGFVSFWVFGYGSVGMVINYDIVVVLYQYLPVCYVGI